MIRAAAILALLLLSLPAWAEPAPGERFHVDVAGLPAPHATRSASNPPEVVRRPPDGGLRVPAGYRSQLVGENFDDSRNVLVAEDGTLIVVESGPGRLLALKDRGRMVLASGFDHPHGLARVADGLLVGDVGGIWHLPWRPGERGGSRRRLTAEGAFGQPGGHWTRNLVLGPDDNGLFVAIGSQSNIADEPIPRATIQHFRSDGSAQATVATGLRNPVGMAIRPGTDELWAVVNERDGMGDRLVPDYLTRIQPGAFYGWPNFYIGNHPQPRFPATSKKITVPDMLFEAHSAPLGLAFWHGDAFVSLHGSWNRSDPVAPMVVRVPFENGRPVGWYEAFATGFVVSEASHKVWGRPVGLVVGPDDALYLADDAGGTVWRITQD